ncbi:hypothetical protein MPSEU_001105300 [Mayamaea pseudoterrestris]|nr:hypothetical protein MPSEU_001105300 [Mayamaea pseudoterrestris]
MIGRLHQRMEELQLIAPPLSKSHPYYVSSESCLSKDVSTSDDAATEPELLRCAGCKEVWYCGREHQSQDWKWHKHIYKYAKEHPTGICIHVDRGEGSGLINKLVQHVIATPDDILIVAADTFGNDLMSPPLPSPFGRLLGWDIQMYCNSRMNEILPNGRIFGMRNDVINSAAIYLGCELQSGLSRYTNLTGDIFVTGRRMSDGRCLNKDSLWGILNFIWDAMDLYGEENADEIVMPTLQMWARRYKEQTWVPSGGDGGINVYSIDV